MVDQIVPRNMPGAPIRPARARRDGEMAPIFMYKLVGAFTLFAFVTITFASLMGYKAVDLPRGPADVVRDVRVENNGDGNVRLFDDGTGGLIAEFPVEEQRAIRNVFRRFDLMRLAASHQPNGKYRIMSWQRGDIAVTAPDVPFRINLPSGKAAAPFAALIANKTASTGG